jgi:hypothetical protein
MPARVNSMVFEFERPNSGQSGYQARDGTGEQPLHSLRSAVAVVCRERVGGLLKHYTRQAA